MIIESVISQLWDGRPWERDFDEIQGFAVHRAGINLVTGQVIGTTALAIGEAFIGKRKEWREVAKATGFQQPYTFMVGGDQGAPQHDGVIWQCLPMSEIGAHARRWSTPYIGVCVIADPRRKACSLPQYSALVDLLAALCSAYAFDPFRAVRGHGELQGGSKAAGEPGECPGSLLKMNPLRDDVARVMREPHRRELTDSGLIWDVDR